MITLNEVKRISERAKEKYVIERYKEVSKWILDSASVPNKETTSVDINENDYGRQQAVGELIDAEFEINIIKNPNYSSDYLATVSL